MRQFTVLLLITQGAFACFPTSQRSYQYGAPTQQFASCTPQCCGCSQAQQPVAPQAGAAARVAAAGKTPTDTIPVQGSSIETMLGERVSLTTFSRAGYEAGGGGPLRSGGAMRCNFDNKPCCWANEDKHDQLDWQIANGVPLQLQNRGVPMPDGSYLIAYAKSAAPSDEAQFASCSIGCASSDIVVRAKHWQSENVLLQVCLRESFPNNADRNPLLNCQEFPYVNGIGTTEVILPKATFVDIVFVASNFIGEEGDIAILDDIEVSFESDGDECTNDFEETGVEEETNTANRINTDRASLKSETSEGQAAKRRELFEKTQSEGHLVAASERFGNQGFRGGEKAFGATGSKFAGSFGTETNGNAAVGTEHAEETVFASVKTAKLPSGHVVVKGAKTADFSEFICNATKCDFENENTCGYKDAHTTQSIRGLTTKFNVVTGQFMNRITGVKESTEGDYYAATFLFPREMAGLEASVEKFTEQSRVRFHYYEGTHGVQLKGCCSTVENCPFSSDKFVTVADRAWKTASFKCPKGTSKVIFICENTRTNQGACAVDGIGLVEANGPLKSAKPLC